MKPIKHRKTAYAVILLIMLLANILYTYLRLHGILTDEQDYIPYCIGSLGVCAIFFVAKKGRV